MLAGKDGAYEPIGPDYYRPGMVGGMASARKMEDNGGSVGGGTAVEIQR